MKSKCLLKLFILALLALATHTKIISTLVIARHGAEYPRNDLYDGKETKAYRGLITPIGLRQHYNLGTYLRQSYAVEAGLI